MSWEKAWWATVLGFILILGGMPVHALLPEETPLLARLAVAAGTVSVGLLMVIIGLNRLEAIRRQEREERRRRRELRLLDR